MSTHAWSQFELERLWLILAFGLNLSGQMKSEHQCVQHLHVNERTRFRTFGGKLDTVDSQSYSEVHI